jgi:hypothetical protein
MRRAPLAEVKPLDGVTGSASKVVKENQFLLGAVGDGFQVTLDSAQFRVGRAQPDYQNTVCLWNKSEGKSAGWEEIEPIPGGCKAWSNQ